VAVTYDDIHLLMIVIPYKCIVFYRSCAGRDKVNGEYQCDVTWLTEKPVNPLAIGQFVNNQSPGTLESVVFLLIKESLKVDFPF